MTTMAMATRALVSATTSATRATVATVTTIATTNSKLPRKGHTHDYG
ncbi:hypothetical protein PC129_g18102 [Phytophthora cactorum]|uniref:Uncharacterized protein n=1 Tax=Phytophthora cactorum TaxID=29920 RepID=A0A8T1HFI3_9STRA|nr:hypothetical protein PC112_g18449 [Phytophthora cactorum]KAG2885018.1 hypothetical protein PC114_g19882 [Phytophthora cactorum]KAG2968500.1 hypothetical protein PC118_g17979 [Phytophthora cactorum]KAG3027813.1 hypothetical protein PC119_g7223 [Phytophthora cactorum]KAG3150746.1 hypothetical protein PC128_g23104 [Phytophthora cactorum]